MHVAMRPPPGDLGRDLIPRERKSSLSLVRSAMIDADVVSSSPRVPGPAPDSGAMQAKPPISRRPLYHAAVRTLEEARAGEEVGEGLGSLVVARPHVIAPVDAVRDLSPASWAREFVAPAHSPAPPAAVLVAVVVRGVAPAGVVVAGHVAVQLWLFCLRLAGIVRLVGGGLLAVGVLSDWRWDVSAGPRGGRREYHLAGSGVTFDVTAGQQRPSAGGGGRRRRQSRRPRRRSCHRHRGRCRQHQHRSCRLSQGHRPERGPGFHSMQPIRSCRRTRSVVWPVSAARLSTHRKKASFAAAGARRRRAKKRVLSSLSGPTGDSASKSSCGRRKLTRASRTAPNNERPAGAGSANGCAPRTTLTA
eukprot:PhM_4_TR13986/c1_g1_i1/m.81723